VLFLGDVRVDDILPGRGVPEEVAAPVDGRLTAQGRVGSEPVVEVLLLVQLLLERGSLQVDRGPELDAIRLLGAFDLSVQVR